MISWPGGWARQLVRLSMSALFEPSASVATGATYVSTCCIGFTVGAVSASLGTAWPDVAMTAYFVAFSVVIPLAVYPALKRRVSSQPSE